MAKQDDFVRYTIRVPEPLYERLKDAAGIKSVNAEIVERLERSFMSRDEITQLDLAEELRALRLRLERLDSELESRAAQRKAAR